MVKLSRVRIRPRKGWPGLRLLSSVKGRIIAGFGLLVLTLIAVVVASTWLSREHDSDMAAAEQHHTTAHLLQDAQLNVNVAAAALQRYVIVGDETPVAGDEALVPEIRSTVTAAQEDLAEARAQEEIRGDEEEIARLNEISTEAASLAEAVEQVIALRQSGNAQEAMATLEGMVLPFRQFRLALDKVTEMEFQEVATHRSRADMTSDLAFWLLVVSGAIGATFGLAVTVLVARSILRPLSSLEATALAVAGGDLKARAQVTGPRELARLGASLNRMTESLLDASKRRELEAELRESEEKFRELLESAPDAIVIVNGDGRMVLVNTETEKMFGYNRHELLGRPVEMLVPERFRQAHMEHRKSYRSAPHTRPMGSSLELTARRKDGSQFPVAISLSPQKTKDGVLVTSIIRDITEIKRAEEALRESEERYRDLFENANDLIQSVAMDGSIVYVNRAWREALGYSEEETRSLNLFDVIHPDSKDHCMKMFQRVMAGESADHVEALFLTKDGRKICVEGSASCRIEDGKAVATRGIFRDVTERKRAEQELRGLNQQLEADRKAIEQLNRSLEKKVRQRTQALRQANEELHQRNRQLLDARAQAATDGLTGLSNHRAFQERIREEVRRAQETGSPVGLIMLDIDSFKRVNDSLGHLVGDEILRGLAHTLTEVAPREHVYRYGGDEFAVLLPGLPRRKASNVAERLRRAVEGRMDGSDEKVTVSLGIASFPEMAASTEELIYGADAAMYWAKSAGKNRVGDWSKLVKGRTKGTLPWYAADHSVRAPDVVAALVAALAAKDPDTSAHTERCSWYAAELAKELGLAEEETSVVRLASLLHDIGKLAVPDDVLFKPGPLNDEEWSQMKHHSAAALHVLGQIRTITDATPAILHHHEHFDGSGYPAGLAGENIPVASRILLVTDAFDAMTTDRPYRKAMPIEAAIDELKRYSGSQFDPAVVDAFLDVLARDGPRPLRFKAAIHEGPDETTKPARQRNVKSRSGQRRHAELRRAPMGRSR